MSVVEFAKALFKHWWALMSSAVFTGLGIYSAWRAKTSQWIVAASIVLGVGLFFVSAFLAWNDERALRLKLEAQSNWRIMGERFKAIDDGGSVIARWNQDLATKKYVEFRVMGGSTVLSTLCTEMCKEAGRKLLDSTKLRAKFPDLVNVTDDGERWLIAIRHLLAMGKVHANTSSILSGQFNQVQWGDISNLIGASQALCLRLSNEETS
jgi:hypothetical protein